ncbi:hypothetical protein C0993_007097 [Termitomyces sp. T159_Od127]|nr:hypothetical protein C0993_007097 [Termitomyces sp. T159_Od127]
MHFVAEDNRQPGFVHVLLITTGSVASIKAPLIVKALLAVRSMLGSPEPILTCAFFQYQNVRVEVVATKPSLAFYSRTDISDAGSRVWTDEDEWIRLGITKYVQEGFKIGDPILHIELRRWADIVLVAPCSANSLSKIAHGTCDNLATSLMRALSPTTPTYIFPAMNTLMYDHPLTAEHLRIVRDVVRYNVVGPIGKTLACGDTGVWFFFARA